MATKKLTRAQARGALGDMPERTFARLVVEGLPRSGEGAKARFPWPEIHVWLMDRERKKAREAARPTDQGLAESERREAQAKAEIAEMKAAQMRGDSVPVEVYRERLDAFVGGVTSFLTGRLTQFQREIVQAKTAAEAQMVTYRIRNQLQQAGLDYADQLAAEAGAEEEVA
jgi:hypothetical protein